MKNDCIMNGQVQNIYAFNYDPLFLSVACCSTVCHSKLMHGSKCLLYISVIFIIIKYNSNFM